MQKLWALTPMGAARSVAELATRVPLAALELVFGEGAAAVLRSRPVHGTSPARPGASRSPGAQPF